MKKTIVFDLRCLQIGHENRGIGMHARSILEHLGKSDEYDYFFYVFDKNNPIEALNITVPVPYTLITTKTIKTSVDRPVDFLKVLQLVFHRYTELGNREIDFFIQFDFMLGLPRLNSGKKNILMAYDLIPLIFKEDYIPTPQSAFRSGKSFIGKLKKFLRAAYYQERYRYHYRNFHKADILISISENTSKSLIEVLNVNPSKITSIPLAPVFNASVANKPKKMANDDSFIFYIGATDSRKRLADLVSAFSEVRKKHNFNLILAGKELDELSRIPNEEIITSIKNSPFTNDIYLLGYVTDSEKLWLYENAQLFVFPTTYEGFGLPIVEALQNGCPVISYDNSAIREVAGQAVTLVPTGDTKQLAYQIDWLMTHPEKRQQLIQLGYKQSKNYSWSNYMKQLYDLL